MTTTLPPHIEDLREAGPQALEQAQQGLSRTLPRGPLAPPCTQEAGAPDANADNPENGTEAPADSSAPEKTNGQENNTNTPMPTELCRLSPFLPMSRKQIRTRAAVENHVLCRSAWGEIIYSGFLLSTFDEDALWAILNQIDTQRERHRETTSTKEGATYTYRGPLAPLLRSLGLSDGRANHERIKQSLKRMRSSVLDIKNQRGSSFGCQLIRYADWDEDNREMVVTLDPRFYNMYRNRQMTLLDIQERAGLNRPIAKALHRFISSHRGKEWSGHFLTLAEAVNLATDKPGKQIRRQLRSALEELQEHGLLRKGSGFIDKDTIKIGLRAPKTKPQASLP